MKAALKRVIWFLGILAASSSLISLVQHIAHVGLSPLFAEIVAYYRDIIGPVFDALYWPIHAIADAIGIEWRIPQIVRDLHLLSFLGASVYMLAARAAQYRSTAALSDNVRDFVYGATGLGLVAVLIILGEMITFGRIPWTAYPKTPSGRLELRRKREGVLAGWATVAAVIAFYALNAGTSR
ncbi:MAG TPA: hypothetical protein DHW63_06315 [Hyphomonadaceae bacterium]|nr:hypothetical protein [Hyphomonadaceae bacterium]